MNRFMLPVLMLITLTGAGSAAAAEVAPEDKQSDIAVTGNVTLVSDYLWRGQSQTWGQPALQLGLEAAHTSGMYAGFWTSNVSPQWVPGSHIETDWYAGFRNKLPGALSEVGYDLNFLYVYFPGGNFNKTGFALPSSSPNSAEIYVSANYQWLTLKTGRMLSKFYGWDTANSAPGGFAGDPRAGVSGDTSGSYYLEANASQEIAGGWTLSGQAGRQNIRNSTGLSWSYYKLAISKTLDNWTGSLAYSASSEPNAFKNFVGLTNNGSTYSAARPRVFISVARNF